MLQRANRDLVAFSGPISLGNLADLINENKFNLCFACATNTSGDNLNVKSNIRIVQ